MGKRRRTPLAAGALLLCAAAALAFAWRTCFLAPTSKTRLCGSNGCEQHLRERSRVRLRATNATEDSAEDKKELELKDDYTAWLEAKLSSKRLTSLGSDFFWLSPGDREQGMSMLRNQLRDNLQDQQRDFGRILKSEITDTIWLLSQMMSAEADASSGPDPWTVSEKRIPGIELKDAARVMRRGFSSNVTTAAEVERVIDNFVAAIWSCEKPEIKAESGYNVAISSPAPYASVQFVIGTLWGYACRSLVVRLAFDRTAGSAPLQGDPLASERSKLENAFDAEPGSEVPSTSSPPRDPVTLLEYATEFFSHKDWTNMCKPSDGVIAAIESELEDALPALTALCNDKEFGPYEAYMVENEAELEDGEFDEEDIWGEELVTLPAEDWRRFQYRAVATGAVLADAESWVEGIAGELPKGSRSLSGWIDQIVANGALTAMRTDQIAQVASRAAGPLQDLVGALKRSFLEAKLKESRRLLTRSFQMNSSSSGEPSTD